MNDRIAAIERTSPRVAARDGEEASHRLVIRSGALHLGFVALAAFIALGLAAGALPRPDPTALAGVSILFIVSLIVGVALSEKAIAPLVCLPAAALSAGALVGSAQGPLLGVGIPFAAGVVAAELLALAAWMGKRPRLVVPLALLAPAVTTGLVAYGFDGGPLAPTPWGLVVGSALATVFALHARLAEGVLSLRHGADQPFAAALSRWAEGARVLIVRILKVSADDEIL